MTKTVKFFEPKAFRGIKPLYNQFKANIKF